jgi:hypothetical protein
MIPNEIVLGLFMACNGARSLAYLPQIVRLARDRSGAGAVSCLTWALFALANASTAAYAAIVTGDAWVAAMFALNSLFCVTIVGLAAHGRRSDPGARPRQPRVITPRAGRACARRGRDHPPRPFSHACARTSDGAMP